MNILLTGAAGFIGSHATEKFIADGHTVIGIDNFDPFYDKRFKDLNLAANQGQERFRFHEGDITDRKFLDGLFDQYAIDLVVHLAAKAGVRPSIDNISAYYHTNIDGTVNILEAMRAHGVRKMLFASSSSVYGNNEKVPFSESDVVDNPISPYASTKKSGELLCHVYCHLHGFDITCLRFFTVFGPRQRPDLAIHKFTRLMDIGQPIPFFGDGSSARDYTFVEDIVSGIRCAADHLRGYHVYNLGESRIILLREMIDTISQALGKEAKLDIKPMQAGDVERTYADISRARAEIGYDPHHNFADGIGAFVRWYRENRAVLYP